MEPGLAVITLDVYNYISYADHILVELDFKFNTKRSVVLHECWSWTV
jgi:hypothetical protein